MERKDQKKNKECPYCSSAVQFHFFYSGHIFFYCPRCELVFRDFGQNPSDHFMDYFENEYFDHFADDQTTGHRDRIFQRTLDEIEKRVPVGRLLDVGCGCGALLRMAMERGWQIRGVDPSRGSIDYAKQLVGNAVSEGTLKDVHDGELYDAIVMIVVLDLTSEPWLETQRAFSLLKPGGLLYLRVINGNIQQILWRLLRGPQAWRFIQRLFVFHQYSFRKNFLRRLLHQQGYANIHFRNAMIADHLKPFAGMGDNMNGLIRSILSAFFSGMYCLLGESAVFSPSMIVTAEKKQ